MISQIRWHEPSAAVDPFAAINVVRWYMEWSNGRKMDAYISAELDRRYAEYKADMNNTRSKAVVDLILSAHIAPDSETKPEKLDPEFKAFAIRQVSYVLGKVSLSHFVSKVLRILPLFCGCPNSFECLYLIKQFFLLPGYTNRILNSRF
jgi:hypothetical protein